VPGGGIGSAARYHERVFPTFQRLISRETGSGARAGLAICRRITWGPGFAFPLALAVPQVPA